MCSFGSRRTLLGLGACSEGKAASGRDVTPDVALDLPECSFGSAVAVQVWEATPRLATLNANHDDVLCPSGVAEQLSAGRRLPSVEPIASVVPEQRRGLNAPALPSYRLCLFGGIAGLFVARPPATPWRTLLRETVPPLQSGTGREVRTSVRAAHLRRPVAVPRGGWLQ
jgi:hypothetical protein